MTPLCVMLVAAEASGDAMAANLARALQQRLGEGVRFVGIGGARMADMGIVSPFDISELSILGLFEGLKAYPRVVRRANEAAALAAREKPDIAILVDSWGFTLRVAHRLRRLNPSMPIVKYVGPQVWASRPGRARTLARAVDHLLSIHAFDAPFFEAEGLKTTFVGNSALIKDFSAADPSRLRAHIGAAADDRILLVLPGSRPSEVSRMGPPIADAVRRLQADRPDMKVVVSAASTVAPAVRELVASWSGAILLDDEALKTDAMVAATAALACSGTVTTELALAGCPMVVGYRLSPITYAVLQKLIRTPWVTLLNIAAKRFVVPELIQDRCTGEGLAKELANLLDDASRRERQIAEQSAAIALMGPRDGNPADRAADAVLAVLAEKSA